MNVDAVRDAIITELKRQAPQVYFWERADEELFHGGKQKWDEYGHSIMWPEKSEIVTLADRFDMDAVARAAIKAMEEAR